MLAAVTVAALAGCGGGARSPERGGENPGLDILPPRADRTDRAIPRDAYAKPLGAAVRLQPAHEDDAYLRDWITAYTSVTPENALKWEVVEPERGRFDFTEADAIVDAARRTGKRVRGHPLVWDGQLPDWVAQRKWAAPELEAVVREHVRRLVDRYKGRVAQWDVVNEPLNDNGSLTPDVFERTLGERYLDIAFDAAHRADPDAKLFVNEIAADRRGPKQRALLALAGRLRARGVPIDGIGLQNHAVADDAPDRASWDSTIGRVAALGLKLEITEMDVALPDGAQPDAAFEGAQAKAYHDAAAACRAAAACTGLTTWGVTDRWSWLGADKRPLPYDAAGAPKPAATALRAALAR